MFYCNNCEKERKDDYFDYEVNAFRCYVCNGFLEYKDNPKSKEQTK